MINKGMLLTATSVLVFSVVTQGFASPAKESTTQHALAAGLALDAADVDEIDSVEKQFPRFLPAPKEQHQHRKRSIKAASKEMNDLSNDLVLVPPATTHALLTSSNNHFGVSLEWFHGKAKGRYDSMFRANHVANDDESSPTTTVLSRTTLPAFGAQSNIALGLTYQFDRDSDVTVSYRQFSHKTSSSNSYSSLAQLTTSDTASDYHVHIGEESVFIDGEWVTTQIYGYSGIHSGDVYIGSEETGPKHLEKSFAYLVATNTLSETARLSHHQADVTWGNRFSIGKRFQLHPYVGLGWRQINYKNTMTFSSVGARSGASAPVSGTDYMATPTTLSEGNLTLDPDSSVLTDVYTNEALELQSDEFYSTSKVVSSFTDPSVSLVSEYVQTGNFTSISTLGDLMPSYNSRFSGIGPHAGVDGSLAISPSFSFQFGVAMTMPYAKRRISGHTTDFTVYDVAAGGVLQYGSSGDEVQNNVNLTTTSDDRTAFSFSSKKIIPEMEMNLALRYTGYTTQQSHQGRLMDQYVPEKASDYYVELGYRFTQDWSAVKNIDLGTSTLTTSRDIRNKGVYLKAGIDFVS